MAGTEPKPEDRTEEKPKEPRSLPAWSKPVLLGAGLVFLTLAAGFGIGYATRDRSDGPDLTEREAFAQAREAAELEVSRQMARRGFEDGKRSGYRHGLVAGGMAAESDASVIVREQWAGEAQAAAASAQSELAGMTAAPAPPTPDIPGE